MLILTVNARPRAVVATPTTIAVSIRTCGRGLEYITFTLSVKIGAPILTDNVNVIYSNPLPHVLILTAIVVGVATTALGLALTVRINKAYGTINEDEISASDLVEYHERYLEDKK